MSDIGFSTTSIGRFNLYDGNDYNVYCDETCHLEHDRSKAMALGAIWCPKAKVPMINRRIREIKSKHGIPAESEVKWTKASPCNLALYLDLIDYFFDDDDLCFRTLAVPDKGKLKHEQYGQTHDQWYYKMYYKMVFINNLSFGGSLGLGKGWKVSASMSYDFDHKQLTSCNLNVSRDLHCWNMSASINPIGPFKSYTFHLGVNASVLQDLKYDKNSNSSTNSRINWW